MRWICSATIAVMLLGLAVPAAAQQKVSPDVVALAERNELRAPGREITPLIEGTRKGMRLSAAAGELPALLPNVQFANGIIELDVRGKDAQGQSFVGVAFHAVDSTTYEAVYFRPFNFRAADSVRRAHAVQYISHPAHTWNRLRTEFPGTYERAVSPIPDPNDWFHVRIAVEAPTVRVFLGDATEPTLVVNELGDRTTGRLGLWVGNGSSGDFANLTILRR